MAHSASAAAAQGGLPPSLRYVSDDVPGLRRVRVDGTPPFRYLLGGERVCRDREVLARVDALAVPPQWSEVWICDDPHGHLQCTGRDEKGRKQYIYHADYTAFRQEAKFAKLVGFAEALPLLRGEVARQLRRRTWDRERMLALVVRLLDKTHLRIGSARYAEENDTYGLTTLRRRHLDDGHAALRLCFNAKSGKYRRVTIRNRRLARLVREVAELPGYELFRYRDEDGDPHTLDSREVNAYLREHLGDPYTAKDFRTWGGTSLAVKLYPRAAREHAEDGRGKLETRLVRLVARELGNTVSVCREYYIHPAILELAGSQGLPDEPWPDESNAEDLAAYERYALQLIR